MLKPKFLILLFAICLLAIGGQHCEILWSESANSEVVVDRTEQKHSERQDLVIIQDSIPNIIGLPADYLSWGSDEKISKSRNAGRNTNVCNEIAAPINDLYLVFSRSIDPGLASSQIGFPFHFFF